MLHDHILYMSVTNYIYGQNNFPFYTKKTAFVANNITN